MWKSLIFIVCAAFLLLYACAPSLYIPSVEDPVTQSQLMQGRKLYVEKCSGCHNLFLPQQFGNEQWEHNLEEMQQRAMIDDGQKKLIRDYLVYKPLKSTIRK